MTLTIKQRTRFGSIYEIIISVKEAEKDKDGMLRGGKYYVFTMDNDEGFTSVIGGHYIDGNFIMHKTLQTWKQALTEEECLDWVHRRLHLYPIGEDNESQL